MNKYNDLLRKIENLKKLLDRLLAVKSPTDPAVLNLSRKLDLYLNEYEKLKRDN